MKTDFVFMEIMGEKNESLCAIEEKGKYYLLFGDIKKSIGKELFEAIVNEFTMKNKNE